MASWHISDNPPSEEALFFEIIELEERLAELGTPDGWLEYEKQITFRESIRYRKMLLAAIRDGRPEAWAEYGSR